MFRKTSGLYRLNQWRSVERGARLARRNEGANVAFVTEEQRSQARCPARRTVLIQPIQATSVPSSMRGLHDGLRAGRRAAVDGRTTRRLARGAVVAAAVCLIAVVGAQEHPVEAHRHAQGQALENPFDASSDSVGAGRKQYVFTCRGCHGNRGRGDGDQAHAGGVPSDFTDDVWQHGESDGEIFLAIKEGVSADMQPYADQISDEDIWHLVNYLKSLAP